MMPRYHNNEVTNSKILANMAKTATPFPIFGQNSILRTKRRRSRANFFTKMFAIDSFDDPEKELSLTCTVFSQCAQAYLTFL